jgi:hypothetical protein
VRIAYRWVHQVAHLLANAAQHSAGEVRAAHAAVLAAMRAHRADAGRLAPAVDHFLKVSASYGPGLFHCYTIAGLPPTNNDLEHLFGTARHHERRATGRKKAAPTLVVRGTVRLVAHLATRLGPVTPALLRPQDRCQWAALRRTLAYRHAARRTQLRFRRNPTAYLAALEERLLKATLPP